MEHKTAWPKGVHGNTSPWGPETAKKWGTNPALIALRARYGVEIGCRDVERLLTAILDNDTREALDILEQATR